MGKNIDIESITPIVVTAGATTKVAYKTRAGNKRIVGIQLQSHAGDAATVGSKMKLSIDKKEVFSSDFDPSLIAFTQRTPPDERFYEWIDREINNSDIDIEFTGNATLGGTFSIHLKCETDEQD